MMTSRLSGTGQQAPPLPRRAERVPAGRVARVSLPAIKATPGDGVLVFGVVLGVYVAAAWLTVSELQLFLPRTMARTAQVMELLAGQHPDLANVGFNSMPLLLLGQMPLMLLPALNHAGLAANILSAVSAAVACAGTLAALDALGLRRPLRLLALIPISLVLMLPAATGMSGTMALALGVWSLAYAIRWWRSRQLLPLALSSFSLAAACLASPLALIQAGLMPFALRHAAIKRADRPGAAQALIIAYLTPVAGGVLLWLLICLVAGGNPAAVLTARDSAPAFSSSQWTVPMLGPVPDWTAARSIAAYLAEHHQGRDVLVDDHSAYPVMFFAGQAGWFASSSDTDFQQTLEQPAGRVRYILLANPRLEPTLDLINQAWPRLFDNGAEWVRVEQQWGQSGSNGSVWKLFRVAGTP